MEWWKRVISRFGRRVRTAETIPLAKQITVQPVQEARSDIRPEDRMLLGKLKSETMWEYTRGSMELQGDLSTTFTHVVQNRRDYFEVSEELKRYPIAKRILKIICTEVLKPNDRGEIIEVVSENEELQEELKNFQTKFNLDNLVKMVLMDVLNLGEYTLSVELGEGGEGIKSISDIVDQLGVVAFYEQGIPSNYLVFKKDNYYVEPPHKYCHFVIGEDKLRIALNDALHRGFQIDFENLPEDLKKKIPEFVRVGEPIFYSCVETIRQLQILEQVVTATKLGNITQRKLISLQVPASMPVDKVMEACAKFEEMLNSQTGVDTNDGLVTVNEIMGKAGRFTVIPNYTDEKGTLTPLDVRNDPQVDDILHSIDDFRLTLLSSVGIPYSLVFGPKGGTGTQENRAMEIRQWSMFSNMINGIQFSIAQGIIQLCLIHLKNRGFSVRAQDIDVVFKNASVNVGDLEKAEYDDAKQEIVGRKIDFVQKLEESQILAQELNREGIYEWLEEAFLDLTNGIPLFKPGSIMGNARQHQADEPKTQKDQVLQNVRDIFRANRDRRARDQAKMLEEIDDRKKDILNRLDSDEGHSTIETDTRDINHDV